jgi:hypothetical protein
MAKTTHEIERDEERNVDVDKSSREKPFFPEGVLMSWEHMKEQRHGKPQGKINYDHDVQSSRRQIPLDVDFEVYGNIGEKNQNRRFLAFAESFLTAILLLEVTMRKNLVLGFILALNVIMISGCINASVKKEPSDVGDIHFGKLRVLGQFSVTVNSPDTMLSLETSSSSPDLIITGIRSGDGVTSNGTDKINVKISVNHAFEIIGEVNEGAQGEYSFSLTNFKFQNSETVKTKLNYTVTVQPNKDLFNDAVIIDWDFLPPLRTKEIVIGDFNKDGLGEFAVLDFSIAQPNEPINPKIIIYRQTSYHKIERAKVITYDHYDIENLMVADVNGDARDDLIIKDNNPGAGKKPHLDIYLQPDPSIAAPYDFSKIEVETNCTVFQTGDLNSDGLTDIVGFCDDNYDGNYLEILYQNRNGVFDAPARIGLPSSCGGYFKIGDVTGDFKDDIVMLGRNSNIMSIFSIEVFEQQSWGMAAPVSYPLDEGEDCGSGFAIGDIDSDGKNELVVGSQSPVSKIIVYDQADLGKLQRRYELISAQAPVQMEIASLDGGVSEDLIGSLPRGSNSMEIYFQSGGWLLPEQLTPSIYPISMLSMFAVGDINGDGKSDIVFAGESYGQLNSDGIYAIYHK